MQLSTLENKSALCRRASSSLLFRRRPIVLTFCRKSARRHSIVYSVLVPVRTSGQPSESGKGQQPNTQVGKTGFQAVWSAFSTTQSLAGQFWGVLKFRESLANSSVDEDLIADTTRRANEADLLEREAKERVEKAPPPNIDPYLKPCGVMETRYIRMLSSLSALTYHIPKLTSRALHRRHRLHLVTTSAACQRVFQDTPRTALQTIQDCDAMAANIADVEQAQKEFGKAGVGFEAISKFDKKKSKSVSPAELVASKLSAAAAAAANAAAPLANNITSFAPVVSVQSVASSLQSAAAAGHSTAVATIATVTAAVEATWSGSIAKKSKDLASPTDWFVSDDVLSNTRYFVIMGSDTVDHWKTNVTFDPVVFEDPSLGVKVHRGVYDAAQILYERFLPLVDEHVRKNPFAKLCFTGHSLGGSIGTLLMLMYLHRGVVSPVMLSPTYTFGSPAIFCEGAGACGCDHDSCSGCTTSKKLQMQSNQQQRGLLARLGLKDGSVKNVMMHRDIVPRAFACDYSLVADLLKRVGESFKEHNCLSGPHRQAMYYFVGKMLLLQPDEDHTFVGDEGYHSMLPQKPGLFMLREPTLFNTMASTAVKEVASLSSGDVNPDKPNIAKDLTAAVNTLMDNPHPLDILGETAAYGPDGKISRYHNPDNYTRALGGVLRTKAFWRLFPPSPGAYQNGPQWYMPLQQGKEVGGKGAQGTGQFMPQGTRKHRTRPLFNDKQAASTFVERVEQAKS